MALIGLGIFSVFIGAVGTEVLRASRPDLVKKVEDSAKGFVSSFSKSSSKNTEEKVDEKVDEKE